MTQVQQAFPLATVCQVLAVRRSAYDAWRKRPVREPVVALQQQAWEVHRCSRRAARGHGR